MGLFHLVGAVVVLRSAMVLIPAGLLHSSAAPEKREQAKQLEFGWTGPMMNASWLFAAAFGSAALGLQLTYPRLWPAGFAMALLAVYFVLGGVFLNTFKRPDWAVLPMVDLLRLPHDHVLDVGCGAGRTTLALARILKEGRITAFDRFDASYIEGGGRELLRRNLDAVGLTPRVSIVQGDITAMPFANETFDSAVSTHAIDHLGDRTSEGLAEVYRTLKPESRFLMIVSVPEWTSFGLAALHSLFSTGKAGWRALAAEAGFQIVDEGMFNQTWFLLLGKPGKGSAISS